MSPTLGIAALVGCAAVTAVVTWFVMRSRREVLLSQQREELAGVRAALLAQRATLTAEKQTLEDSLKQAAETTRRQALDEFLADIRIEERHYTREHKILFVKRTMLVRQERIFFRNIPLSNWIEHEMPIEEGVDPEDMARSMSVFAAGAVGGAPESILTRLLR